MYSRCNIPCVIGSEIYHGQENALNRQSKSFGLVKSLRDNHISADIDHLGKSLKAQFKYSDKINAKYTIVIGDDELDKDLATLKNMATSEQTTVKLSELVNELKNRL